MAQSSVSKLKSLDDDITGVSRYGANEDRLKQLLNKQPKITAEKVESSSSSSSSSSESEEEDDEDKASVNDEEEDLSTYQQQLAKKVTEEAANERRLLPVSQARDKVSEEVLKMKKALQAVQNTTAHTVDDESESDDDVRQGPKKPAVRLYKSSESENDFDDDEEDDDDVIAVSGTEPSEDDEEDGVELKFTLKNEVTMVFVKPNAPFKEAFAKFTEKQPLAASGNARKFNFSFDGDAITATQTPEDLGMEDGDQVDVKEK